ncbi:MAG: hypothetical protein ACR2PY_03310, partial [Salinispira sp.]
TQDTGHRTQDTGHRTLYALIGLFIAGVLLVACEMYDANGFNDAGIHQDTGTRYDPNGYDKDGYAGNSYDKDGYNAAGYDIDGYNADGYDAEGYNRNGYKADSYNAAGFNADGNHRNGTKYNPEGYDVNGYDKNGFNTEGKHRDTGMEYNLYGYGKDGYNAAGFNADGNYRDGTKYNPESYDEQGYDEDGFNVDGYDINGYDKNGFNAEGINRATGMISDRYGYAKNGYTAAGDHRDDFILAAVNTDPGGIWSDGTTMWVSDKMDNKIYAYNMITKERDAGKDFNTLVVVDAGGDGTRDSTPGGIWSDGTTMWVLNIPVTLYDSPSKRIYAYNMDSAKANVPSKTISYVQNEVRDIWSDGTTMWLTSSIVNIRIYAYDIQGNSAVAGKNISPASNTSLGNIWSDETTLWVADGSRDLIDAYVFNANGGTLTRDTTKDFATIVVNGNNMDPVGIWSNGTTMWLADDESNKIYAYDMATGARPPKTE